MASQYYTVSFNNTLYLSATGDAGGMKCRVNIPNAYALRSDYSKTAITDMRGNTVIQKQEIGKKGRDIEITVETWIPDSVMEDLFDIEDGQNADDDTVTLQLAHDTATDYDLEIEIMEITWGRVENGKYFEPVIRVRTFDEVI